MLRLPSFRILAFSLLCFCGLSQASASPDSIYRFLGTHVDDIEAVAASPNNTYFASGSWDKTISIFSYDSNFTMIQSLSGHNAAVTSLEFSRDGKNLISGGKDYKVIVWKLNEETKLFELNKEISMVHTAGINSVLYGPGMKMVYSAGDDGRIMIYDLTKSSSRIIENKIPVNCIALSTNRRFIFCADESTMVKQYDGLGNLIKQFEGHSDWVNAVAYSIDNKYLVTGSNDKSAIVWDVNTGKVKHTLVGHEWKVTSVSITGDSKYVVTGSSDGTIKVWNIEDGSLLKTLGIEGSKVRSVAFSADEKLVIAGLRVPENEGVNYGAYLWKTGVSRAIAPVPNRPVPKSLPPNANPNTKPTTANQNATAPGTKQSDTTKPSAVTGGKTDKSVNTSKKVVKKTDEVEVFIEEE